MKSRFHLSNRFIICALIVLGIMTLFATPTVAQPVDGTEAPAEFQRDLVDDDSPGGTTERAIQSFERDKLQHTVARAMQAAAERAVEMAQEMG